MEKIKFAIENLEALKAIEILDVHNDICLNKDFNTMSTQKIRMIEECLVILERPAPANPAGRSQE